jgi:transcriptional regulator with XRE-family HTH domain
MWRDPDGRDDWAMAIMGAWLRDWRWETGATQRQLAKLAGVDQAHISRIENGLRRPSGIPLARLIIALDWLATADSVGRPFGSLDREPPNRHDRWGRGRPPMVLGAPPPNQPALAVDPMRLMDALLGAIDPVEPALEPAA